MASRLESPDVFLPVAAYVRVSTDMQKYSLANQQDALSAYADLHHMHIVRTYSDDGKSGLTAENRPGLLSLLHDIGSGHARFRGVLVLDVTRWGRFQNTDEAAYHEFLCWKSGVKVFYVAELFENDGSPFSMVFKGLKRAMAAEYSRELSIKAFAGHRRLASLGYRQGATPGFGIRRMLLSADGEPRGLLKNGERKSIKTDRVVLVPGPPEEVALVRWMFEHYLKNGNCAAIARELNARGILSDRGKPWVYGTIRNLLDAEKYAGRVVYNRASKKLAGPQVKNPENEWIRHETAYEPVVPPELFEAVKARRIKEKTSLSNAEVLDKVRAILQREGRLSRGILESEPDLLSGRVLIDRFGSLTKLYEMVGFKPSRDLKHAKVCNWLTVWRRSLTDFTHEWLSDEGSHVAERDWCLQVDGLWTVSFTPIHVNQADDGRLRWINYRSNTDADLIVFARMAHGESAPLDYLVLPRTVFSELPKTFYLKNTPDLESCRFSSLAILGDLARVSRMEPGDGEGDGLDEGRMTTGSSDGCIHLAASACRARLGAFREAMRILLGDKGARGMLAQCGYLRLGQARIGRRAENGSTDGVAVMEGMVVSRLVSAILRDPEFTRWMATKYPDEMGVLSGVSAGQAMDGLGARQQA